MSIRDYMDSRERFEYDDNRMLESERETERRERFHEVTEAELADMNEIERLRNAVEFYKLAFAASAPRDPKDKTRRFPKPRLVPAKICLPERISGDWPFGQETQAGPGDFDCECNQYGAISVRAENGKMLGVRLHECDILEWKENDKL